MPVDREQQACFFGHVSRCSVRVDAAVVRVRPVARHGGCLAGLSFAGLSLKRFGYRGLGLHVRVRVTVRVGERVGLLRCQATRRASFAWGGLLVRFRHNRRRRRGGVVLAAKVVVRRRGVSDDVPAVPYGRARKDAGVEQHHQSGRQASARARACRVGRAV